MKNNLLTLQIKGISILLLLLSICSTSLVAQKSPAASAENEINGMKVTINYFSPRVRERTIWGDLVPYDKVWRTGANNATTLEVSEDVKINGKKLPKGKYALFTIPKKGEPWTVILNKVYDQWGAFNYDEKEDIMRFEVPVSRMLDMSEELVFDIDDEGNVIFKWEYLTFKFKLEK